MPTSSVNSSDGGQWIDLQVLGSAANSPAWKPFRAPDKYMPLAGMLIAASPAGLWSPSSASRKIVILGGDISIDNKCTLLLFFGDPSTGTFVHRTPMLQPNVPYHFDLGPMGRVHTASAPLLATAYPLACNVTGTLYGCED